MKDYGQLRWRDYLAYYLALWRGRRRRRAPGSGGPRHRASFTVRNGGTGDAHTRGWS